MSPQFEQDLTSFVLRFVREVDTDKVRWRGRIRHVQSNQEVGFIHIVDALQFMQDKIEDEAAQDLFLISEK